MKEYLTETELKEFKALQKYNQFNEKLTLGTTEHNFITPFLKQYIRNYYDSLNSNEKYL